MLADFGSAGLWLWNSGAWAKLTPLDADQIRAQTREAGPLF